MCGNLWLHTGTYECHNHRSSEEEEEEEEEQDKKEDIQ